MNDVPSITNPDLPETEEMSTASAPSYQIEHNPSAIQSTFLPTITFPPMSVNTTAPAGGIGGGGGGGGSGGTVTIPPHSNRGMRGVPLSVFNRTRSNANEFWAQFHHYKLVNCTHDSMTKPFDQVLTTLTYIQGPVINNWVNSQEEHLAECTDITKRRWVHETDEVLWQEFEAVFQSAWTDTSKKQNVYNQLMKLTMNRWDIDTYIAMFKHLSLAAGWALDAEGMIVRFCEGLNKMIHSKALDQDKISSIIDEWKAMAWNEVTRAKEKYNVGLTGVQQRNQQKPRDFGSYQHQSNQPRQ
jgi:hypothetical protein